MKEIEFASMRNKGFTLIELVIVMVVIGILAVTAAPKFINFKTEAHIAVLNGIKGSINSMVTLSHMKARINNQIGSSGQVKIEGTYYDLRYGYPTFIGRGVADGTLDNGYGILQLIDISDGSISYETPNAWYGIFKLTGASNPEQCVLTYFTAELHRGPIVGPFDKNGTPVGGVNSTSGC